jgi:hypothetical protein
MTTLPIVIVDSVSDSGASQLCKLKMKRSKNFPETGMFSADALGVEYLPGKKMDVTVLYNPLNDEIFVRAINGKRKIMGVASKLGSIFEASASIKADTELRITIET